MACSAASHRRVRSAAPAMPLLILWVMRSSDQVSAAAFSWLLDQNQAALSAAPAVVVACPTAWSKVIAMARANNA